VITILANHGTPNAREIAACSKLDTESRNSYSPGMKAIVSEKGQVTIPKALRTRLGIRPGAVLDFDAEGGRLVAHKTPTADAMDAAWGILELSESVDGFVDRARGRG
jgi:antitoxin PrlF